MGSHQKPADMKSLPVLACFAALHLAAGLPSQEQSQAVTPSEAEYDQFFNLVDSFLWDSFEETGRMYRRGYFRMARPAYLTRRTGEPSSAYRAIIDTCYDFACWSGLNSVVNSFMRLGK